MKSRVKTFFLVVIAGSVGRAVPSSGGEIRLEILRPASTLAEFTIQVWRQRNRLRIPYAGAKLKVSGPGGFSRTLRADLLGRAPLDPLDAWGRAPGLEQIALDVSVPSEPAFSSRSVLVSRKEMIFFRRNAAESLNQEGNRLARGGNLSAAVSRYLKASALDPTLEKAVYNAALSYEKLGDYYAAIEQYRRYLLLNPRQTQDSLDVKRKVIQIAKNLHPQPPPSRAALRLLGLAREAVSRRKYLYALAFYEQASVASPWWPEPYYAAGLLEEYLTYHDQPRHCQASLKDFGWFLAAAPGGDPRIPAVQEKIGRLEGICRALSLRR